MCILTYLFWGYTVGFNHGSMSDWKKMKSSDCAYIRLCCWSLVNAVVKNDDFWKFRNDGLFMCPLVQNSRECILHVPYMKITKKMEQKIRFSLVIHFVYINSRWIWILNCRIVSYTHLRSYVSNKFKIYFNKFQSISTSERPFYLKWIWITPQ